MRPVQGRNTGGALWLYSDPFTNAYHHHAHRRAHIYIPERKHCHNHPTDKTDGKYWAITFETDSTFKSNLMNWTSATLDSFYSKGDNLMISFPSVNSAVSYCETMGWGYTVTYPRHKWHTYKNYSNNFAYKGSPKVKEGLKFDADYD